ncbi:NAD-dependent epimerase/dehydratase family protein [Candidatus Protochlamydia sp. W-9]|uniref:NAD-dependent epimerase/dehydratase family protein n=1 Tax=Candidatus Protochlamydia sp. W-9 TaxID=1785087 RepID=UPI00096AB3C0|nr:NAD-dependent epimerase/dehydratase family protein [Candidatus Protochlamydia sp. W-9]
MPKSKKLVIIGGNGFIGHNAIRHFINNYELVVIDRKPIAEQLRDLIPPVKTVFVDIQDKNKLLALLDKINPHYILNLASKSTIQDCFQDPEGAYLDNVLGNLNVLMSCLNLQRKKKSNFEKLIVHSSDKAYGEHPRENLPYQEEYPHFGGDVYSSSKATQDMMTMAWAKHLGLSACVLRSGNIYGPGDLNMTRLIPKTICRIFQKKPPIVYQKSLSAIRDFVFIEDLLSAYDVLFKRGKVGEAYNVGGSEPMMVENAIEIIKKVLYCENINNEIIPSQLSEINSQYLNSQKLKQLNWFAKTTFRQGIIASIPFYKKLMEGICSEY